MSHQDSAQRPNLDASLPAPAPQPGAIIMMEQFVVWEPAGVRYLCLRTDQDSCFVERIKRL